MSDIRQLDLTKSRTRGTWSLRALYNRPKTLTRYSENFIHPIVGEYLREVFGKRKIRYIQQNRVNKLKEKQKDRKQKAEKQDQM